LNVWNDWNGLNFWNCFFARYRAGSGPGPVPVDTARSEGAILSRPARAEVAEWARPLVQPTGGPTPALAIAVKTMLADMA